jgi:hypothetical protein
MLVIREEQMEVLREYMRRRFEDRMVAHFREFWTEECDAMGEESVRQMIRKGSERAAAHGITKEYDIARYVNIMFALGPDFETDPATEWAGRVLSDEELGPRPRMDLLCDRVEQELEAREARAGDGSAGRGPQTAPRP